MRKDKPSRTALKVALNIVTLGSKPGMEAFFLPALWKLRRNCLLLPVRLEQELYDGPVPNEWSLSTKRSTGCCRVSLRPLLTERHSVSAR